MANFKVNFLNAEDTNCYTKGVSSPDSFCKIKKFFGLGIYSELAAQLLSQVISYKFYKWHGSSQSLSDSANAGILVRAKGDVAIDCHGEVGILFEKYNRIINLIGGELIKILIWCIALLKKKLHMI